MTITVEAVYENGVLRPTHPLALDEHEKVELIIRTPAEIRAAMEAVRRSAGTIPWSGDVATLERIAVDPEFGIEESP
jgi:predicted DNA-binding antitoxin AbrB/MazE fold protein